MRRTTTALIEIVGVNGQRWTVSGDGMGDQGVILSDDPEGLFDEAPFTSIWQQGATQEGATLLGSTAEPIDLVLGFQVFEDELGMLEWADVEARFFASFSSTKEARIEVTTEAGRRTLRVLKLEKSKQISRKDPRLSGYSRMELTLRAPWPFWEGDTYSSTFAPTGTGGTGFVTVFNPTDRPLWLQWVATAPGKWGIPDFSFDGGQWADRIITTPTLTAGQDLTIDTYPRYETYVAADGSNIAGRFGGVDFLHPVPPGSPETQLPVVLTGGVTGSMIQCRMVHFWQRPQGRAV